MAKIITDRTVRMYTGIEYLLDYIFIFKYSTPLNKYTFNMNIM